MSAETLAALRKISADLSSTDRKVSPMQLAAQLLEESLGRIAAGNAKKDRGKAGAAVR